MFAIIKDNTFVQFLASGTPFTLDDVQYPANWLNLSTPEEKAALGIVDVVYAARPNDKFYWVSEAAPVVSNGVVTVSYTATPKDLPTLITSLVDQLNATAFSILSPSDWMAVKAFETGTKMADPWNTWRAAIRTQAGTQRTAIQACTTVEQLAALPSVQWANDPNYVSTQKA